MLLEGYMPPFPHPSFAPSPLLLPSPSPPNSPWPSYLVQPSG